MKRITLYTLLSFLGMFSNSLFAQVPTTACTGVVAPVVQTGTYATPIGATIWTPAPVLTTQAVNLTNVEYLIVKYNECAKDQVGNCDTTNGGGDVIIGFDADGIFDPATITRYGYTIQAGDTFGIVPVGYNLAQVKALLNQILTGTITGTPNPCCGLFNLQTTTQGFCDSLENAGIDSVADVNNLGDVLTVFDGFSDTELSVNAMLYYMQQVNGFAGLLSSFGCGTLTSDGNILCYGINDQSVYYYVAANNVAVNQSEIIGQVSLYPNPTNGDVTLQISTEKANDLTVNIYNALGQKVSSQNLGVVNGEITVSLATAEYAAGMYVVELSNGRNNQTYKLMVR
jgi:hypothetical protein